MNREQELIKNLRDVLDEIRDAADEEKTVQDISTVIWTDSVGRAVEAADAYLRGDYKLVDHLLATERSLR
jgi:hypothetical protein